MDTWADLYEKLYLMSPKDPSDIVVEGFQKVKTPCKVLDIACGRGRNSVYAASLGCEVDAIDIEDVNIFRTLENKIGERINFSKKSIMDFGIKESNYGTVIATRFFQYISPENIQELLKRIGKGLVEDGLLMANYTANGGMLSRNDIEIEKYHHDLRHITDELYGNSLNLELIRKGEDTSTVLPERPEVETYEFLARKR